MHVILNLGRRQDCCEFRGSLGYVVTLVSKKQTQAREREKKNDGDGDWKFWAFLAALELSKMELLNKNCIRLKRWLSG